MSNKAQHINAKRFNFSGVPKKATVEEYVDYFRRELEAMDKQYAAEFTRLLNEIDTIKSRLSSGNL